MRRILFVFLLAAFSARAVRLGDLRPSDEVPVPSDIVSATNAIPVSDLSAYATTGHVAAALAAKEDISPEWRSPAIDRIVATASTSRNHVATNAAGDVAHITTYNSSNLALDLEARRLDTALGAETVLSGSWSILAGSAYATLDGATLIPTTSTGPVAVGFEGEDGTDLRASVAINHASPGRPITDAVLELEGTWRKAYGDAIAARFRAIDPNGPKTVYRHMRGGVVDCLMTNLNAQQLYTLSDGGTPNAANPGFFDRALADLLRCCSVGRTDYNTGPATRPATFVAPHYAICASHYTPSQATFCLDRDAPTFRSYAFRAVASRGDLTVLRTSSAAFPAELLPAFVRSEDLRALSPSILTNTLGVFQSLSTCVHPFVVTPLTCGGGIYSATTQRPSDRTNATYADLAPYAHTIIGGDSGRVHFLVLGNRLAPVVFASSGPLVHEEVQSWLDGVIQADSGGAESLAYLTRHDIEGE